MRSSLRTRRRVHTFASAAWFLHFPKRVLASAKTKLSREVDLTVQHPSRRGTALNPIQQSCDLVCSQLHLILSSPPKGSSPPSSPNCPPRHVRRQTIFCFGTAARRAAAPSPFRLPLRSLRAGERRPRRKLLPSLVGLELDKLPATFSPMQLVANV